MPHRRSSNYDSGLGVIYVELLGLKLREATILAFAVLRKPMVLAVFGIHKIYSPEDSNCRN
jgi:hypothetical protein